MTATKRPFTSCGMLTPMFRISSWFGRRWMQGGFMKEVTFTNRSKSVQLVLPGALVLLLVAGCASTEIAVPGSATVRITRVARDIAGCTAVGNVKAHLGTDEKGVQLWATR